MSRLKLSVVIPTYNEIGNIGRCLSQLVAAVEQHHIPYEVLVVDGNSSDGTERKVAEFILSHPNIRLISKKGKFGIGDALQAGFDSSTGDLIIPLMADCSDDVTDLIKLYQKGCEGYDAVYTNRFMKGGRVRNYPLFKLFLNRIFNTLAALLFFMPFTDSTNAFKAYKTELIRQMKLRSSGFEILIEIPLKAFLLGKSFAQIPVAWDGRKKGVSKLKLLKMGPRYVKVLFSLLRARWFHYPLEKI